MIHSFKYCQEKVGDLGEVAEVKGGVIELKGFKGGRLGEGVVFESGEKGVIESISNDRVQVMILTTESLPIGAKAVRTGKPLRVSVGKGILGHSVSSLGYLLDQDKQESLDSESEVIKAESIGISQRRKIKKQLLTGVGVCDLLLPLGEGQRELILGDKKTGKTGFVLKAILNQAQLGKICVYSLIGKKQSEVKKLEMFLEKHNIKDRVVLVVSSAGVSAGEVFLNPFTAMAIAEHFRDLGQDSLVVLDDLTTHAKYFREITLLSGRFPGRESYPGDVFYTHAELLERAGNFLIKGKEVSITALAVAETQMSDLTGYIQTNLMSMTDGHLFFDEDLFLEGVRPAIDVFSSVTRVGKQTQGELAREMNSLIVQRLKERQELERYLKFGAEMTEEVKRRLKQGDCLRRLFSQSGDKLYPINFLIVLAGMVLADRWDGDGADEWLSKWEKDTAFKSKLESWLDDSKDVKGLIHKLGGYEASR